MKDRILFLGAGQFFKHKKKKDERKGYYARVCNKKDEAAYVAQKTPTLGRETPILGVKESRSGINHKNQY